VSVCRLFFACSSVVASLFRAGGGARARAVVWPLAGVSLSPVGTRGDSSPRLPPPRPAVALTCGVRAMERARPPRHFSSTSPPAPPSLNVKTNDGENPDDDDD